MRGNEMTLEELNANYQAASWLIARRSAAAAGKALIFSAGSLDDAAREIAAVYGLSDEECARVHPGSAHDALSSVQTAASGLFGDTMGMTAGQAMSVAKTAVASGQKGKVLQALMQAGPGAAKAVAAGGTAVGKVAGSTAGKGTPWGWIATAVYAAGTGSWFAYNLRRFNLAAYELVRLRENIELPAERLNDPGSISSETFEPVLSTISAGANAVGAQASSVWDGVMDKGGQAANATGGFLGRFGAKWKKKPEGSNS